MRIKQAKTGYIWAYKEEEKEVLLGDIIYLGINDDGSRYYEIPDPSLKENQIKEETNDRQD